MVRILGIDPGSIKTGFGIIHHHEGRSEYITSGVLRLPKADLPQRLKVIYDNLNELIEQYQPAELAIEQVFMARNAASALKLGQARGAAIVACVTQNLAVAEYSARQIKQAVVGTGAADKAQVQHMVSALLNLPGRPQEDAADALAAALCHAHSREAAIRLAQPLARKTYRE